MKEKTIITTLGFLVGSIIFNIITIPTEYQLRVLFAMLIIILAILFFDKKIWRYFSIFLTASLIGVLTIMEFPQWKTIAVKLSIVAIIVLSVIVTIILGKTKKIKKQKEMTVEE